MRFLVIIAAACLAFLFLGCDTYDADNYAETLIDQELSGGGHGESVVKLSAERMGFDLADYFAFETGLSSDPRLQREVNEELCDLAPDPEEFSEFYYKLLDGGPLINLPNSPEYVDGVLGMLGEGFSYNDLTLVASSALNMKERKAVSAGEVARHLERFGLTPRSVAALSLLLDRRATSGYADFVAEPVEEYLTRLGFEMVKPLESPSSLVDYVKLHLTALEHILDKSSDPDAAFKYALERLNLTEKQVGKLDEWLASHRAIAGAVTAEIAWRLKELTEDYKNSDGLTFHLAGNVFERVVQYRGQETKMETKELLVLACKIYDLEYAHMEKWQKMAESFNAYLDRIGKPRGLSDPFAPYWMPEVAKVKVLNDENFAAFWLEAFKVETEADAQKLADDYGWTDEELEKYFDELKGNERRADKLIDAVAEKNEDAAFALEMTLFPDRAFGAFMEGLEGLGGELEGLGEELEGEAPETPTTDGLPVEPE